VSFNKVTLTDSTGVLESQGSARCPHCRAVLIVHPAACEVATHYDCPACCYFTDGMGGGGESGKLFKKRSRADCDAESAGRFFTG